MQEASAKKATDFVLVMTTAVTETPSVAAPASAFPAVMAGQQDNACQRLPALQQQQ